MLRPVYTSDFAVILAAIFAVISSAISNCLCKLLVIQITTELPVVLTGDF